MDRPMHVYFVTNWTNEVLYTGVTNDLQRRIYEHKYKVVKGFTNKYNLSKLVYYELFDSAEHAILREKKSKNGEEKRKISWLIK